MSRSLCLFLLSLMVACADGSSSKTNMDTGTLEADTDTDMGAFGGPGSDWETP